MMTVVAWHGRVVVSPEGGCGGCWKREPPINLALSGLDRPQAPVIVKVPRVVGDAWSGGLGSYRRLVEVGMEVGVHPLTQTGGGAGLTSLREGRGHSAAGLGRPRVPMIVEIHPTHHSGEVGWC